MKILITTPAGNIGRRVLAELLAPEFSLRVVADDASQLPEEIRDEAEVVRGSSDDAAILSRALEGVEALFLGVPAESFRETNVRGHYERFAHAAAQAVREVGTPRVVSISAGCKGLARNAGPVSGLHAMEDILNQSGAAIRHLRCGWFMENFLQQSVQICEQGILSYPMPGHIGLPMTAITDVADVALRWLVRRDWSGIKVVPIHGPEDLSFNQAAAIMERVLERPVRYSEISGDDYIRTLVRSGAGVDYAHRLTAMFGELARGITGAEPRTPESTTSTTLSTWARMELLPITQAPPPLSSAEMASA